MPDFDKIFGAFRDGFLYDAENLLKILDSNSILHKEFYAWLKDKSLVALKKEVSPPESVSLGTGFKFLNLPYLRLCPSCGAQMILFPVREPKGRGNVYGFLSRWECFFCGHEIYSLSAFADERQRFLKSS